LQPSSALQFLKNLEEAFFLDNEIWHSQNQHQRLQTYDHEVTIKKSNFCRRYSRH